MSGYFDPHAEAQMNGFAHGRIHGEQDGFDKGQRTGYQAGFDEGHEVGYAAGQSDTIARANKEILKQMAYTKQHLADKEVLAAQIEEQRKLIEQLTEKIDALEHENASLKQSNQGLRDVVSALKAANEKLATDLAELDEKYKKESAEYNEQIWNINRIAVFSNSVRAVLEDLTKDNGPQAQHVRELFAKHYAAEVTEELREGTIRIAPHLDRAFMEWMPNTQKFIQSMLRNEPEPTADTSAEPSM